MQVTEQGEQEQQPTGERLARAPISHDGVSDGHRRRPVNVHELERAVSLIAGAGLLAYASKRLSLRQTPVALAGGALLYRGAVGYCPAYGALGLNTAEPSTGSQRLQGSAEVSPQPIVLQQAVTVGRTAAELYALWREPETLSQVMAGLADVTQADAGETKWSLRLPLSQSVEYTTRVTEEREPELIRWQSAEGGLEMSGALQLAAAPGDWGTEVTLQLRLQPPFGAIGRALVKALGPAPKLLVQKALRRFKSLAEAGEIPTLHHNPAARHDGRDH